MIFQKLIFKLARSIVKLIMPCLATLFIKLKINRRIINILNDKSHNANNYYNFNKFISSQIKEEKLIALDVGAQGGFNSDKYIANKYERFFAPILVEPISKEYKKLKNLSKKVLDKGFWSSPLKKKIYILGNRSGSSSMYEPDETNFKIHNIKDKDYVNFDVTETVEVDCDTIDNSLEKLNIREIDYLKIDTQGSELEILKGMRKYKPLLIRLEAHIFSMYKNVPNWTELIKHLDESSYIPCDWKGIGSHVTRIPAEMDIIFIPNFKIDLGKKLIFKNKEKFICLMLIFGQLDLLKAIAQEIDILPNDFFNKFKDRYFF